MTPPHPIAPDPRAAERARAMTVHAFGSPEATELPESLPPAVARAAADLRAAILTVPAEGRERGAETLEGFVRRVWTAARDATAWSLTTAGRGGDELRRLRVVASATGPWIPVLFAALRLAEVAPTVLGYEARKIPAWALAPLD